MDRTIILKIWNNQLKVIRVRVDVSQELLFVALTSHVRAHLGANSDLEHVLLFEVRGLEPLDLSSSPFLLGWAPPERQLWGLAVGDVSTSFARASSFRVSASVSAVPSLRAPIGLSGSWWQRCLTMDAAAQRPVLRSDPS